MGDREPRCLRYRSVTSTTAGDPHLEQLIEEVRKYPCLYNINSLQYRDQFMKEECWKIIATCLYTTPSALKKEWKRLRDGYRQALVTRRNSKTEKKKKALKPWKYEEQMDFLKPYICPRRLLLYPRSPSSDNEFQHVLIKREKNSDEENISQEFTSELSPIVYPRLRYRGPILDIKLDPDASHEPKVGEKKRKKKIKDCPMPNKRPATVPTGNSGNNRQDDSPPTPYRGHSDITLLTKSHSENENVPLSINSGTNDITLTIINPGDKATGSSDTNDVTPSNSKFGDSGYTRVIGSPGNNGITSSAINNPGNNGNTSSVNNNPGNNGSTSSINHNPGNNGSTSSGNNNPGNNGSTSSVNHNPGNNGSTSSVNNNPGNNGSTSSAINNPGNNGNTSSANNNPGNKGFTLLGINPGNKDMTSENNSENNGMNASNSNSININPSNNVATPSTSNNGSSSSTNNAGNEGATASSIYTGIRGLFASNVGNHGIKLPTRNLSKDGAYVIFLHQDPSNPENNGQENRADPPTAKVLEYNIQEYRAPPSNSGVSGNRGSSAKNVPPSNLVHNGQGYRASQPSTSAHGNSDQQLSAIQLFLASIYESINQLPLKYQNNVKINSLEFLKVAEEEFEHFKVQWANNDTSQSTSNQGTSGIHVNLTPSTRNQDNNGQDTRAVPPTTNSAIEFLGDSDQGNVALQLFLASIHESIRSMPGYLLSYMKINLMELVNTAEELSKGE